MFKWKVLTLSTLAFCAVSFTTAQAAQTSQTSQNNAHHTQSKHNNAHNSTHNNSKKTTTKSATGALDITQPKPLDNKVFDSMVGNWESENNMLGMPTHSTLDVRWALDHQYLIMDLKAAAVNNTNRKYEAMAVLGINGKGQVKGWLFDSWGADAVNTGTGKFEGSRLILSDSGDMFSETRTIEVKGSKMVMHSKGQITENGKKTNFDETVIYKKK